MRTDTFSRFEQEVQSAFAFLMDEFHFSKKQSSSHKVCYESSKVRIDICHGDYDFEILLTFGRMMPDQSVEQFDFALFLQLVNPALEKSLGERIAAKPDKIHETVQKLAAALHSEGMGIIKGDDNTFNRMKSVTWWQFRPDALK
ncbi:MAG: hypothetical protein LBK71_12550 [Verrucomicrobiales bacterium]|jgi:hypothetical protein|nr:hypothetical protein [Verrucomicrobiales bacterium]